MENSGIRLTQYSHGAGCGCKIAPHVLDQILQHSGVSSNIDPKLLVGNASRDDAAVYDLGDGTAVISTTDFFMPIVDDPESFGRIASVNAISDVYAMGGDPLLAIAILGWPVNQLSAEVAGQVLEGSKKACAEAGIPLAGGHSIDSPEPIFGLAVTGRVRKEHLKQNNTANAGSLLFLTKPLGIGILTTAEKKGILLPEHVGAAARWMETMNRAGAAFGKLAEVKAMTDVTGFGLLGHLLEMCNGSNVSARLRYKDIPVMAEAIEYVAQGCTPGGTQRNWSGYGHQVSLAQESHKWILADPQTSGGLLVAVDPTGVDSFLAVAREQGLSLRSFGELLPVRENIQVEVVS
jgi:selenide,water dikinase